MKKLLTFLILPMLFACHSTSNRCDVYIGNWTNPDYDGYDLKRGVMNLTITANGDNFLVEHDNSPFSIQTFPAVCESGLLQEKGGNTLTYIQKDSCILMNNMKFYKGFTSYKD